MHSDLESKNFELICPEAASPKQHLSVVTVKSHGVSTVFKRTSVQCSLALVAMELGTKNSPKTAHVFKVHREKHQSFPRLGLSEEAASGSAKILTHHSTCFLLKHASAVRTRSCDAGPEAE